jgi:hypothetical protein
MLPYSIRKLRCLLLSWLVLWPYLRSWSLLWWSGIFPFSVKPENLLLCSQDPVTQPYLKSVEFSSCIQTYFFKIHFNILPCLPGLLVNLDFQIKILCNFFSPPVCYMSHPYHPPATSSLCFISSPFSPKKQIIALSFNLITDNKINLILLYKV